MKIKIQTHNFDADESLLQRVYQHIQRFSRYTDNDAKADVSLTKQGKTDDEDDDKRVEIRLSGAGSDIYADSQSESFEMYVASANVSEDYTAATQTPIRSR